MTVPVWYFLGPRDPACAKDFLLAVLVPVCHFFLQKRGYTGQFPRLQLAELRTHTYSKSHQIMFLCPDLLFRLKWPFYTYLSIEHKEPGTCGISAVE